MYFLKYEYTYIAMLKIRTIYHARDLWKLARS